MRNPREGTAFEGSQREQIRESEKERARNKRMDSMNITEHDIKDKYRREESDMNIHKTKITKEMKTE